MNKVSTVQQLNRLNSANLGNNVCIKLISRNLGSKENI